ncbi:MAG: hypothetical protein M3N08_03095 [Pseudomonadota bacterium]|nr:hypothetical protein [Pseudomonadota bacterium]
MPRNVTRKTAYSSNDIFGVTPVKNNNESDFSMQPLNAYRFYELGSKLHNLFDASTQRVADMFAPLAETQTLLDTLIKDENFPLQTSRSDATRLLNKIGSLFNRSFIDPATKQLKPSAGEGMMDPHEMSLIRTLVEKFEHAFAAELNRVPTYVAEKCGIYSTYELAENARQIFGGNLRSTIPNAAQAEFDSAGRSLAFGLGTAAAIHTLRAVEIMLRAYYESFAGTAAAKGERNYAIYIKKLVAMADEEDKTPRPDKRVVQMLAQIKDQYRNPLVTPETGVAVEEAAQLFGMASTLIALMARQMQAHQPLDAEETEDKGSAKADVLASTDEVGEPYDFQLSKAG